MRSRAVVVACVALVSLFGGCSGGAGPAQPSAPQTAVTQTPTAPPASSAPPAPSSPAAGSEPPSAGSQQVTAADGALTWTMPCTPKEQAIRGNEEDRKTYRSYRGWLCGEQGAATSGAFVVELIREPGSAGAARQAMRTALQQLARTSNPTDNDVAGQPGISDTAELNGKQYGLQVISFGSYLALFIATPAEDLQGITDSVQVR